MLKVGGVVAGALALVALSAVIVAPVPSYDPWAWLLWGREVAGGELSTREGPAFKPLPVAVCAMLSALGGVAPTAWVIVARAGALLAICLGFRLGRRLAGGSVAAGVLAGLGVALCGRFPGYAATGVETGSTLALGLAAAEAWRAERPRLALACGVGCALLRVETWPFLLVAGIVLWRRRPEHRRLLAACAIAVPTLWLVPELIGSGDVLRSGSRARMPNPGQPALADVPALASLRDALALPLWPLLAGAIACVVLPAARPARGVLAAGAAWVLLVAVMAQAGFSGEPRYAVPGAALGAIAGAVGLAAAVRAVAEWARGERDGVEWAGRRRAGWEWARGDRAGVEWAGAGWTPGEQAGSAGAGRGWATREGLAFAIVCLLILAAAAPRLAGLPDLRRSQAWQRGLAADLRDVIRAAGGREAVLACGRPYVGHLRGPLLAYHLDIEKRLVGFEPEAPGAVFRSRLNPDRPVEPVIGPAFPEQLARDGRWEVRGACRVRVS